MDTFLRWILRRLLGLGRLFAQGGTHYHQVLNGFIGSRAMMTGVGLGLFDALRAGPRSQQSLIADLGLDVDGGRVLLDTCVAHNLIRRKRGVCTLHRGFRKWLDGDGVPEDILHGALTYDDTSQLDRCAQGDWPMDGRVRRFWGGNYADLSPEEAQTYTDFMQRTVSRSAGWVIKAYPFAELGSVLDVGGGSGTLALALSAACPKLSVGILDLAHAEPAARARIDQAGAGDRVRFIPGDFLQKPLPEGFDAMLLHRVLWDWDDERAAILLRRIHAALPVGGRLLIAEGMRTGDEDVDLVLGPFDLYMCLGGFRLRTRGQVVALVEAAGFVDIGVRMAQPVFMPIVVARKP